jgi:hypothetical protein
MPTFLPEPCRVEKKAKCQAMLAARWAPAAQVAEFCIPVANPLLAAGFGDQAMPVAKQNAVDWRKARQRSHADFSGSSRESRG